MEKNENQITKLPQAGETQQAGDEADITTEGVEGPGHLRSRI